MAQPAPIPSAEVPLTVWPCGQPPTGPPTGLAVATAEPALLPAALAERLLTEFTHPGDLIYDLSDGTVQTAAVALGRPATRLVTTPAVARRARAALRGLPATQRPLAQVRLVEHDHALPRMVAGPPGGLPELAGAARLLVAAHTDPDPGGGWLATRAANWPGLLTPGGLAVVVTCACRHAGRLVDNAALTVAACEQAGLVYLQHIIALLVPIHHGRLAAPNLVPALTRGAPPRVPVHQRVHADVLVFTSYSQAGAHG